MGFWDEVVGLFSVVFQEGMIELKGEMLMTMSDGFVLSEGL
jgi:hypothetical protein